MYTQLCKWVTSGRWARSSGATVIEVSTINYYQLLIEVGDSWRAACGERETRTPGPTIDLSSAETLSDAIRNDAVKAEHEQQQDCTGLRRTAGELTVTHDDAIITQLVQAHSQFAVIVLTASTRSANQHGSART